MTYFPIHIKEQACLVHFDGTQIAELGDDEAKEALAEMRAILERIKNYLMMHQGSSKGSE